MQKGLQKQCKQHEESDDNYKILMNINELSGAQPDGYSIRFPFYVLGERDASVVFTETQDPDWFSDNVYEFSKIINFYTNKKKLQFLEDCK